jgi:hypothetical protein
MRSGSALFCPVDSMCGCALGGPLLGGSGHGVTTSAGVFVAARYYARGRGASRCSGSVVSSGGRRLSRATP